MALFKHDSSSSGVRRRHYSCESLTKRTSLFAKLILLEFFDQEISIPVAYASAFNVGAKHPPWPVLVLSDHFIQPNNEFSGPQDRQAKPCIYFLEPPRDCRRVQFLRG